MISQSPTAISFSWVANSNNGGSAITDYQVYWNQGSGSIQYLLVASNGLSPTSTTVTSPTLLADKAYTFWVTAKNAVGFSGYSNPISIYSASLPGAPGTPFRMSGTSQTQIVLGWTANPLGDFGGTQLTSYSVWWDQGPILKTFVNYGSVNAATFSQTIPQVTTGQPYNFYIVANNIVGSGPRSEIIEIYAAIVPNAPVLVQQVAGTQSQTSITIQWTAAFNGGSPITGY